MRKNMAKGLCVSVLGMFVMACSGCGGGGGGSSPPPVTQAQQPPKTVLIEAYGDSTTLGAQTINGVLTTTPNSEPAQLQTLLQQRFGTGVTISNQGVGGEEAFQLLSGIDGKHSTWAQQMSQSRAQIVLLNFALNDSGYWKSQSTTEYDESPQEYGVIMADLIQTARNAGKIVVLEEPNPTSYQPTVGTLIQFVTELRQVAAQQNVPLVAEFDYIQSIPNWKSMLSDTVHPDDQLYGIKAQQTFNVVEPIVQSMVIQ